MTGGLLVMRGCSRGVLHAARACEGGRAADRADTAGGGWRPVEHVDASALGGWQGV